MRIGSVVRSAALGLVLALAAALAGAAQAGADAVVGAGKPSVLETILTIDAHSGPSGESPSGFAETQFAGGRIPVSCLAAAGNQAVVGVAVGGALSTYILIVDNGPSGGVFAGSVVPGDPAVCPAPSRFVATIGPSGLDFGDYIVVDDPALPTSKEQCKNDGWKAFGEAFRNQGQCVAFVQRGPKP